MIVRALVRGTLALYRAASRAATPLARAYLHRRRRKGREDAARVGERLGQTGLARPERPVVWLHAASVGEALSVLPLVERIRGRWPDLQLLMTTGTVTSARLMAERLPEGVLHQFAPLDLAPAVERFLDHWRPRLGLLIESEFWPNLMLGARTQGCDLALINGRMSPASYASWRRIRPAISYLLEQFSMILAQSPQDQQRFSDLSARDAQFVGNLKFAGPALRADKKELATLERALEGRPLWLAASTHAGEESIVGQAHRALAADFPGLVTLLVPRHPERGPEIAALLRADGLKVSQRSLGEAPAPGTQIYLADTIGELGLWYRMAEVVFMGKSLVPKGGQNPLEAAKLGCAILAGPHCDNFKQVTREMLAAGALGQVADGAALTSAVGRLLADPEIRESMAAAGLSYGMAQSGVLDRFVEALTPYLDRAAGGAPTAPATRTFTAGLVAGGQRENRART